jgi:hypothetical protein
MVLGMRWEYSYLLHGQAKMPIYQASDLILSLYREDYSLNFSKHTCHTGKLMHMLSMVWAYSY